jgi:hypothetical protein
MKRTILHTIFYVFVVLGIVLTCSGQDLSTTRIVGGNGGTEFSDPDLPAGARVQEVRVFSGKYVDALQMVYILPDGRTTESVRHGGPGGRRNSFRLDSDEYITGISIRSGNYIDSIQIHTNKRSSQAFGGSGGGGGVRVDVPSGNQGVGFTGRAGDYLDAVGLTCSPLWLLPSGKTDAYGGRGGSTFADNRIPQDARVSAVYVWSGKYVDRIQLVYTLRDGSVLEGDPHGGSGGSRNVFNLEPGEYITGISGRYGDYIDGLTIRTNKRTSQRFGGSGGGRDFNITVPSGYQAVGLVGRAGGYLDAIGLAYAPSRQSSRDNRGRRSWRDWNRRQ